MAPAYPPFMYAYGIIAAIIGKIQEREAPPVFSHDYLRFTLGFARESDRAFLGVAKRIGLVGQDGVPTALFHRVRKPKEAPAAIAEGLKIGFSTLYEKRPDLHSMDRKELAVLIAEVTGLEPGHANVRAIVGTTLALIELTKAPESAKSSKTSKSAEPVARAVERRKTPDRRVSSR